MENKYYTPLITEFKVGFRYERAILGLFNNQDATEWQKETYSTATDTLTIQTIETLLDNGFIRVKCLDESDFEEAGWSGSLNNAFDWGFIGDSSNFYMDFPIDNKVSICTLSSGDGIVFQGTIRNYNELLDVMQMLNINNGK